MQYFNIAIVVYATITNAIVTYEVNLSDFDMNCMADNNNRNALEIDFKLINFENNRMVKY